MIVRAAQERGTCVLTVSDNGIGMSPEELEKYSGSLGWIDVCKGWQEE